MNAIPETGLLPAMSAAEQALQLLVAGLPSLLSVDSDRAWHERVAAANARAMAEGRLRLLHVDLGPTGPWDFPTDAASLPRWPAYWRDPLEAAGEVDLVLVDGCLRVACALAGRPRLAPARCCWCMTSGTAPSIAPRCSAVPTWPAAPAPSPC